MSQSLAIILSTVPADKTPENYFIVASFYTHECFVCLVYLCTTSMPGTLRSQQWAAETLKLEL